MYTFKLNKKVKFHDGTPVTANDWVYTFKRAKDATTKSPVTASYLRSARSAEATDDYTYVVKMANPDFYQIESFSDGLFMSPLSQAQVEKWGDQYGRHPVSVGPFKFKEWITGQKIVLERNPDFTWGPQYTKGTPTYIQTLEFIFLPENATRLAALEAGEIDVALVEPQDLARVQAMGKFQTFEWVFAGISPCVEMNTEKPPLNDVRVRQALNLSVDREAMIKTVALGQATVQYGPISSSVAGYWPGIEKIGYGFDLPRAKDLMKQAGFTAGSDGMLQKDGQPVAITLLAPSYNEVWVKVGQVLKEQWKALGITINLSSQGDVASITQQMRAGEYQMGVTGWGNTSAMLMGGMFFSGFINVLNDARINDPDLDKMLMGFIYTGDKEVNAKGAQDVQKYIIEKAYIIPLYSPKRTVVVSNRVKGVLRGTYQGHVEFYDAWIEAK
jgi:peptide/nickel transport system substrate-binding protein